MQDLIAQVTNEFVLPPDLQKCLLYISRFRKAIMQVTEMSEFEIITYFTQDLLSPTREELQYRRCATLSQAVKIALEYD
ncbi:hypothetical protein CCR75_002200 [Bremia lactucae]|uniref:Uncharacterized protein n=1 Tax=Bremia lactucae TaxID=4779 RepID=A0A976FNQ3_BRELC|nr:hypothetical protein CCR75_002200 [Bremia lactucae]